MMHWDPHGAARLEEMQHSLVDRGLVALVREAAADVWRANRARHEPEELFDDIFTLSVLSSRNLANRLYSSIREDEALTGVGVWATRDFTATVIHVDGVDVRLVKNSPFGGT